MILNADLCQDYLFKEASTDVKNTRILVAYFSRVGTSSINEDANVDASMRA